MFFAYHYFKHHVIIDLSSNDGLAPELALWDGHVDGQRLRQSGDRLERVKGGVILKGSAYCSLPATAAF